MRVRKGEKERKVKFELAALTETKLKGNGEVSWCGMSGIFAGVQKIDMAKEGMVILMNNE